MAVEEFQSELRRPIRLEVLDHEGDCRMEARVRSERLEELGAVGAMGPLTQDFLAEVAGARETACPWSLPSPPSLRRRPQGSFPFRAPILGVPSAWPGTPGIWVWRGSWSSAPETERRRMRGRRLPAVAFRPGGIDRPGDRL